MNHLKSLITCACLVGVACLLPPGVSAQANPRIGVWTLDLVTSTYHQGKAPASETRTFLATDDGGIQMTGDTVLSSGTKQPTGYRAKYDGKDHAVQRRGGRHHRHDRQWLGLRLDDQDGRQGRADHTRRRVERRPDDDTDDEDRGRLRRQHANLQETEVGPHISPGCFVSV